MLQRHNDSIYSCRLNPQELSPFLSVRRLSLLQRLSGEQTGGKISHQRVFTPHTNTQTHNTPPEGEGERGSPKHTEPELEAAKTGALSTSRCECVAGAGSAVNV